MTELAAHEMTIMRAIIRGERDPEVLAAMRHIRLRASAETVKAALIGNYCPSTYSR